MSIRIGTTNNYDYIDLDLGLYPDNTPVVDLAGAHTLIAGKSQSYMLLRAASMQEFFTGMMVAHSLEERGAKINTLIIPCIPGGRQDRLKWEGDWLFTIKYVAEAINARNFDKVITVDPHSLATTALINRLLVPEIRLSYHGQIRDNKYDGVIAPDIGARARAVAAANDLGLSVLQGSKHRDPVTNRLSGFSVENLKSGFHYLVVDDLCDAGGTFLGLAEVINKAGATADLFVTHGLFTKGTENLRKAFKHLYTTDSSAVVADGVTVLNITEGLTIYV